MRLKMKVKKFENDTKDLVKNVSEQKAAAEKAAAEAHLAEEAAVAEKATADKAQEILALFASKKQQDKGKLEQN